LGNSFTLIKNNDYSKNIRNLQKNAIYDRKCLNLSEVEKKQCKQDGRKPVIRLKMPDNQIK